MITSLETQEDQALLDRKALLLSMLEAGNAQKEKVEVKAAEPVPAPEVPHVLTEEVVETIHFENRVNMATSCFHEFPTVFVLKGNLPEYQRLMGEYQDAMAEALNADTLTIELVMGADEARRSLNGFRNRLAAAERTIATAQEQVEAAQRVLAEAGEKLSTAQFEYEGAQLNVIETIRKSEEASSRADSATFRSIALANKANRFLLDKEIVEAERAMETSARRANAMGGSFANLDELNRVKHMIKVPFAFRTHARKQRSEGGN
jgi:hypothetical protein